MSTSKKIMSYVNSKIDRITTDNMELATRQQEEFDNMRCECGAKFKAINCDLFQSDFGYLVKRCDKTYLIIKHWQGLAEKIAIPKKYLSQVVNS